MIQERYRADYAGEFVITETKWSAGKKTQTREWVPNPIENHHISGRAACIGSSVDKYLFDYSILQRHRGGLLGSKKLQTYGVGEVSQDMRLDFTVETGSEQLQNLIDNKYTEKNIVYTSVRNCIAHPGEFYLIPYAPRLSQRSAILYLAAFDGHKEVFLLGYHKEMPTEISDMFGEVNQVFAAYPYTTFYLVGHGHLMPPEWDNVANVKKLNYREFISYCDV